MRIQRVKKFSLFPFAWKNFLQNERDQWHTFKDSHGSRVLKRWLRGMSTMVGQKQGERQRIYDLVQKGGSSPGTEKDPSLPSEGERENRRPLVLQRYVSGLNGRKDLGNS
ncbi:MAG: hypothetical protein C5B50_01945 [Verrucomicrobia bacterium]|nr:MAG: hypothetical protein C5B50_01945 [Verrucomicrobiota bacterium]